MDVALAVVTSFSLFIKEPQEGNFVTQIFCMNSSALTRNRGNPPSLDPSLITAPVLSGHTISTNSCPLETNEYPVREAHGFRIIHNWESNYFIWTPCKHLSLAHWSIFRNSGHIRLLIPGLIMIKSIARIPHPQNITNFLDCKQLEVCC